MGSGAAPAWSGRDLPAPVWRQFDRFPRPCPPRVDLPATGNPFVPATVQLGMVVYFSPWHSLAPASGAACLLSALLHGLVAIPLLPPWKQPAGKRLSKGSRPRQSGGACLVGRVWRRPIFFDTQDLFRYKVNNIRKDQDSLCRNKIVLWRRPAMGVTRGEASVGGGTGDGIVGSRCRRQDRPRQRTPGETLPWARRHTAGLRAGYADQRLRRT